MRGRARPEVPPMTGCHPRLHIPHPPRHRGRTFDVREQERQRLRGYQPRPLTEIDANRASLLNGAARTSYVRHRSPE
jgi:hypothetical protein